MKQATPHTLKQLATDIHQHNGYSRQLLQHEADAHGQSVQVTSENPYMQALICCLRPRVRHTPNCAHRGADETLVPVEDVRLQFPQNGGAVVFCHECGEHVELQSAREQRVRRFHKKLLQERSEDRRTVCHHRPAGRVSRDVCFCVNKNREAVESKNTGRKSHAFHKPHHVFQWWLASCIHYARVLFAWVRTYKPGLRRDNHWTSNNVHDRTA